MERDGGVFISHIAEEAAIALVLQKTLRVTFGDHLPVFVSTDKESIPAGLPWYHTITTTLLRAEAVIVLLSQESNRRPWINFEAGVGIGGDVPVIPLTLSRYRPTQVTFPLAGMHIYTIDDIDAVITRVAEATGRTPIPIDRDRYIETIKQVEAALNYKSLVVTPVVENNFLRFYMENTGNTDLELLMLEVRIPRAALSRHWFGDPTTMDSADTVDGTHRWLAAYSPRGACAGIMPILRPIITPTMGKLRPNFSIPLAEGYPMALGGRVVITFQLHAVGYATQPEDFELVQFRLPSAESA